MIIIEDMSKANNEGEAGFQFLWRLEGVLDLVHIRIMPSK
jgi:hypothetical protein